MSSPAGRARAGVREEEKRLGPTPPRFRIEGRPVWAVSERAPPGESPGAPLMGSVAGGLVVRVRTEPDLVCALVLARVAVQAPRDLRVVRVQGRHPEAGLLDLGFQRGDPGGLALGLGLGPGLVLAWSPSAQGLGLGGEPQQVGAQEPARLAARHRINRAGPEAEVIRPGESGGVVPRYGPFVFGGLAQAEKSGVAPELLAPGGGEGLFGAGTGCIL